ILDLAALRTDPNSPFVRSLPAEVDPSPVAYFTDGSVLHQFRPEVPLVVWGPGDSAQMHSADERLEITQLQRPPSCSDRYCCQLLEDVLVPTDPAIFSSIGRRRTVVSVCVPSVLRRSSDCLAISASGWTTLLSCGVTQAPCSIPSNPIRESSAGMLMPCIGAAEDSPTATMSLAANTAVGGLSSRRIRESALAPNDSE